LWLTRLYKIRESEINENEKHTSHQPVQHAWNSHINVFAQRLKVFQICNRRVGIQQGSRFHGVSMRQTDEDRIEIQMDSLHEQTKYGGKVQ
jgi:hypothetical protein